MTFLMWFDDNAKKAPAVKAQEAIAAYEVRYGVKPNVLLFGKPVDLHIDGMTIQTRLQCGEHCIWVGQEGQRYEQEA